MAFKINISRKDGRTFRIETESEILVGKKINEIIPGEELKKELQGYELKITGTSDRAGFPGYEKIEGQGLKKLLLTKGFSMRAKRKGLRLRKTLRGNLISKDTIQINTKVEKQGNKALDEIFPEQMKKPEENKTEEKSGENN